MSCLSCEIDVNEMYTLFHVVVNSSRKSVHLADKLKNKGREIHIHILKSFRHGPNPGTSDISFLHIFCTHLQNPLFTSSFRSSTFTSVLWLQLHHFLRQPRFSHFWTCNIIWFPSTHPIIFFPALIFTFRTLPWVLYRIFISVLVIVVYVKDTYNNGLSSSHCTIAVFMVLSIRICNSTFCTFCLNDFPHFPSSLVPLLLKTGNFDFLTTGRTFLIELYSNALMRGEQISNP